MQNANPSIEVQRATTTAQPPLTSTGGNCTACFDTLNATQKSDFESNLQNKSMVFFGVQINTIEQLCTLLEQVAANGNSARTASEITTVQRLLVDVPLVTSENIGKCLLKALNVLES
jgi:hypothetical protein